MKLRLLSSLFTSLPLALIAQPTLDYGTSATQPGESFMWHSGAWHDPGPSGEAQAWDFSDLVSDSIIYINFGDPDTTADGPSFPTATIVAEDEGAYAYTEFNVDGGLFLGNSVPGDEPIVYSDPMQQALFPCSYGATWTDDFAASFTLFGALDVERTGTIDANADGWGSLMMPFGSYPDVLRITFTEDYTDDAGFATSETHREYTYFLTAGTHYPLLEVSLIDVTVLGNTTTIESTNWLDPLSTVVADLKAKGEFLAYPSPATDYIDVRVDHAVNNGLIELVDAQGRVVRSRSLNGVVAGGSMLRLDVNGLDAGLYVVRLTSEGRSTTRQVAVQ